MVWKDPINNVQSSHTHTYNPSVFSIHKAKLDAKCPHDNICRPTLNEGPIS
jgi:hypothetical protein